MKALITGITGQDGSYLAEFLLGKGYEVHGTVRRSSSINTNRIDGLISENIQNNNLFLHYADLLDPASLTNLITIVQPDEIYNLGAQSHVAVSFKNPLYTSQTSTIGPIAILEAIKNSKKDIKFYQASSSEMYGGEERTSLDENSPFYLKVLMLHLKYLLMKQINYTESRTIFLVLMGYYLIMNLLEEEKRL